MRKLSLAFVTITALAAAPAAFASTLCPNSASQGGFGSDTFTTISGPNGSCGSGTAVNMSISVDSDYAKLTWDPTSAGYPAGLTIGGLSGITGSVSFSSGGSDQPYYELAFTDNGDPMLNATIGDQILLIEFQQTTVSGNSLYLDPNSTLFNLYNNTQGFYMIGGQADANTLANWIAFDPSLSGDSLQQIRVAVGLAGGSAPNSGESLTVDSLEVNPTPEPSSLLLLGTGLAGLGLLSLRKIGLSGSII